jgi:hypothetical protein
MSEQSNNNGHQVNKDKEAAGTIPSKPMTLTDYAIERNWRLVQGERPVRYAGGVSIVRTKG